jgi:hypothetical protein
MIDSASAAAAHSVAVIAGAGAWILCNMILYAFRRSQLHDLAATEVLLRHLDVGLSLCIAIALYATT